jgi:lipopolysaccharide export system protein LptA
MPRHGAMLEKVNITGAAAFYYPDRKYMRITGGARMVNNKDGVVISGETIERFSKTNILIVTGYVVVLKPKEGVKILAGRMKYNTKTKEMTLVGNVKIWENKKENLRYISGDRVFVTRDDKKRSEHMVVTGNAYMEEKKKKKLIRKVNAGKIDYYSVKDKKDKKVVEKIILSDHAYIVTEKQKIRALKITVDKDLKEKKEVWELFERVFVKDLKSEDEMRGGYMIYNKTDEVIRVTKNPSFYVFKEKAYIYSDVITSYRNKKLSVFVGDVEILQEDQKIYGENAVFNERLKRIVITGEPLIINKDNITYADKVTFLTDKKEVRLSSRFRGVLLPDEVSGRRRQGQNGRREHKRVEIGDIGGPEVL